MKAQERRTPAHKIIASIVWILISNQVMSQGWLPEFRIRIDYKPVTMLNTSLSDFLQQNHSLYVKDCATRMTVFYFRINYKGMVDSVHYEGNFSEGERNLIIKNIRNTSGNWSLPTNTSRGNSCWFVYPCFILGQLNGSCADDPANQRQFQILRSLLSSQAWTFDKKGLYHLPPNTFSGMSTK